MVNESLDKTMEVITNKSADRASAPTDVRSRPDKTLTDFAEMLEAKKARDSWNELNEANARSAHVYRSRVDAEHSESFGKAKQMRSKPEVARSAVKECLSMLADYKPMTHESMRVSQQDCDHRFTKGVCYGCGMFYSQIEDSVALSNRLQGKNLDEFRGQLGLGGE